MRQTGADRWLARCPAHDHRHSSLSVRELPDGRVLVHHIAGCGVYAVCDAVGLTVSDLFPPNLREILLHRTTVPAAPPIPAAEALRAFEMP
ncbi:MAG: hypothetical protein KGJ55_10675 [Gammaproteobacteria bacterium]|nr:hypothetical protein [Gammaproteobacteria bacterium]